MVSYNSTAECGECSRDGVAVTCRDLKESGATRERRAYYEYMRAPWFEAESRFKILCHGGSDSRDAIATCPANTVSCNGRTVTMAVAVHWFGRSYNRGEMRPCDTALATACWRLQVTSLSLQFFR